MINSSPIPSPPQELVEQWHVEAMKGFRTNGVYEQDIATQAAQWGADQELEACCKWLECNYNYPQANPLRTARRPKPPSLKEQALEALDEVIKCLKVLVPDAPVDGIHIENIRRAIEALPND